LARQHPWVGTIAPRRLRDGETVQHKVAELEPKGS